MPGQQKVQPLYLLPPGTIYNYLKGTLSEGEAGRGTQSSPFSWPSLTLSFLSPTKAAFCMGSSSACTKDSHSQDYGYSCAVHQGWALLPSPTPPRKKKGKQASLLQPFAQWGSLSLWRVPSSTPSHPLLPTSTLHCLPFATKQASRWAKCESTPAAPARKYVEKKISVTEANLIQPSGRLLGSLAKDPDFVPHSQAGQGASPNPCTPNPLGSDVLS